MLREDHSTDFKSLTNELRHIKPKGWSVVVGLNGLVVRPKDRMTGKFHISFVSADKCCAAFFSRELNYWNKYKYFDPNVSLAVSLKEWMESAAADPLKRESDWSEDS